MQFTTTVFALVGVLAASTNAQWGSNYTTPAAGAAYPTGTGSSGGPGGHGNSTTLVTSPNPSQTGATPASQWGNGAVGRFAGSGLGLLVAGGVAFAL